MTNNIISATIVENLIQSFDTPFYLYSEEQLINNVLTIKEIDSNIKIFFSMKANPNPNICKIFIDKDCGVEVASGNELEIALKAGFNSKNIFFTAPSKSIEELKLAIENDIFAINVDNLQELILIEQISEQYDKKVYISFRINQELHVNEKRGLKMSGDCSPFGIEFNDLKQRISSKPLSENIECIGIHTFQGSENFNLAVYEESWNHLLEVCEFMESRNHNIAFLGLGGGFGYDISGINKFDFNEFSKIYKKFIIKNQKKLKGKVLAIESGTYLTRNSGYYVTKVMYTKNRNKNFFVFVDGGTHHIEGDSRFATALRGKRQVIVLNDLINKSGNKKNANYVNTTIMGKLCTPLDILSYKNELPVLKQGNIVIFPNCGAYGLTSSRVQFLSHDYPPEILLKENGDIKLIKTKRSAIGNFD